MKTVTKKESSTKHKRFKDGIKLRAPKNSNWYIDDSFYKMGVHGLIFYYDDGEWINSSKGIDDIFSALKSKDKT